MHKVHIALPLTLLLALNAQANSDTAFDEPWLGSRLEQQTPAGSVPALGAGTLAPGLAEEQHYIAEPAGAFDQAAAAAVISSFSTAYRQAGAPRMAVYFNRELSDEVREWVPGSHHKVAASHSQSASYNSLNHGAASVQGTASATIESQSRHYVGDSGKRPDMYESWHWQFEDAITNVLLNGGANVVDRAVIFRQMARQAPQTAGMDGSMSSTLNEMSALDKYADVLIEMKVTRSATEFGYDFRAVAKNVDTGQVVGTAFVNGDQVQQHSAAVSRASGYALKQDTYQTLEQVSQELPLKLMQSLSNQWGA